ncbi:MAG: hypothetical protein K2X11_10045 [Acetobacteraceae bacterium]|nr:hypothetical protein [Acetobacteraceae bacterium]
MPERDQQPALVGLDAFLALAGPDRWRARVRDIGSRIRPESQTARAAQRRHALEIMLARLSNPGLLAKAGQSERRILDFAREAALLAEDLADGPRERLRALIGEGLEGEATLVPLFHLLRTAGLFRARGFEVRFDGLLHGTSHDLMVRREGSVAEVACETVSAEEGRPVHRGHWAQLVDRVNPDLQTWLAAHPGRYILKMTLPAGVSRDEQIGSLHERISAMLANHKRQDSSADAVLKLDPLVLAGAHAGMDPCRALPGTLRQQFGLEAHLAVTTDQASGSVFVMAARAGRENEISGAVKRRLATAAEARLSGKLPGILAVFLDDLEAAEWRNLRDTLELEGVVRRFLTEPAARPVVAVTCATRMELLGTADAAPDGELRFRNPAHPAAKAQGLEPAITSSM